jgi:hypothetical protein
MNLLGKKPFPNRDERNIIGTKVFIRSNSGLSDPRNAGQIDPRYLKTCLNSNASYRSSTGILPVFSLGVPPVFK